MIKTAIIKFLVIILTLALLPASAMAYMRNVELSIMSGSGTFEAPGVTDASVSRIEWNFGYTRYFDDIKTDSSPYGTREFLAHPSRLGIAIDGMGGIIEDNNSADEMSMGEVNFVISGMYYIDNGDYDTGIGLALISTGEGMDSSGATFGGTQDDETSGGAIRVSINQYLSRTFSIALEVEGGSYTWEDNLSIASEDSDRTRSTLSLNALLSDKIWLEAAFMSGETDRVLGADETIGGIRLLAGYYLNQKTGVFVELESETTEIVGGDEEELGILNVGGDYYFNKRMHLMVSLASMQNNITTAGIKREQSLGIFRLNVGFFF